MRSALCSSDHNALVLDCSRSKERLPVSSAGGYSERRRDQQDLSVHAVREVAVELGKAKVVANRQSDHREPHVDRNRLGTGF